MDLIELMMRSEMAPFSIALLLVAGLLTLEVVAALFGGSLLGAEADFDADFDADLDADLDAEADIDGVETGADGPATGPAGGILSWLGIGQAPIMIWLAGMLTAFGLSGYAVQTISDAIFGGLAPTMLAVAIAAPPAAVLGARFARLIGRLIPKTETEAVSRRYLGGRVGVLVQGSAETGRPAQAKVRDRHGNPHYLRVEPYTEGDVIREGEEIIVLRGKSGGYRAMRLEDAETFEA